MNVCNSNEENSGSFVLKALVVEDSLVTQRLISMLLNRFGFDVTYRENGVDGIKATKEDNFDIIFLDVMMPIMDGYQVCKMLKGNKETRGIPVIMLTSRDGMFDKVKGKMAGSDVYLTKPIQHADLIRAVGKFFPLQNGAIDLPAPAAASKPVSQPPAQRRAQEVVTRNKDNEADLRQRLDYLERRKMREQVARTRKEITNQSRPPRNLVSISERLRNSHQAVRKTDL